MSAARPLRDVFDELAGGEPGAPADPRQVLAASGYDDLPDPLLSEAIVNYADSAPLPVAEQLAPFVRAHSPVPDEPAAGEWTDPEQGLGLLAAVPPPEEELAAEPELTAAEGGLGGGPFDAPVAEGGGPGEEAGPAEGEPAFGAGRVEDPTPAAPPDLPSDPYELDFGGGLEPGYGWEEPAGDVPGPDDPGLGFTDAGPASGPDDAPPEGPEPVVG